MGCIYDIIINRIDLYPAVSLLAIYRKLRRNIREGKSQIVPVNL